MFADWRDYRNSASSSQSPIDCDLEDPTTFTPESFSFVMCRFIPEIRKLDGGEFPGKTLYEIVLCVQFHLETLGINWKILDEQSFSSIRYTLDNIMKIRTQQGIGNQSKQADVLTLTDEDIIWHKKIANLDTPQGLLNATFLSLGLGCALRAGKEHHALRSYGFDSQISFHVDNDGRRYFLYREDIV